MVFHFHPFSFSYSTRSVFPLLSHYRSSMDSSGEPKPPEPFSIDNVDVASSTQDVTRTDPSRILRSATPSQSRIEDDDAKFDYHKNQSLDTLGRLHEFVLNNEYCEFTDGGGIQFTKENWKKLEEFWGPVNKKKSANSDDKASTDDKAKGATSCSTDEGKCSTADKVKPSYVSRSFHGFECLFTAYNFNRTSKGNFIYLQNPHFIPSKPNLKQIVVEKKRGHEKKEVDEKQPARPKKPPTKINKLPPTPPPPPPPSSQKDIPAPCPQQLILGIEARCERMRQEFTCLESDIATLKSVAYIPTGGSSTLNATALMIENMLLKGVQSWAPKLPFKRAVIDFSSPNVAMPMSVSPHLRSTIVGDAISRMWEYAKVDVIRRNHIGDWGVWGTDVGMLVEYLRGLFPDWDNTGEQALSDAELQMHYNEAMDVFKAKSKFRDKARKAFVLLQQGHPEYKKAWSEICQISRREFQKVYNQLGVSLEEMGESSYSEHVPKVLKIIFDQGLLVDFKGAGVIDIEGKQVCLMQSNGTDTMASIELAALWYRLNEEKAEQIIYVSDVNQSDHFVTIFKISERAGLTRAGEKLARHVALGHVLGEDKEEIWGCSIDLLDEARSRCEAKLVERGKAEEWGADELKKNSDAIAYGAIKYNDLKYDHSAAYTLSFDEMLGFEGNTGVYLQFSLARVRSIIGKSCQDLEKLKKEESIVLDKGEEGAQGSALGLHLIQFPRVVKDATLGLKPSVVCEYLYKLSQHFEKFCDHHCPPEGTVTSSALLLCEATSVVMSKCFHLLGIQIADKLV